VEIKRVTDLLLERLGLAPPYYETPEGQERVRTIRLQFRLTRITEIEARKRLHELGMPGALVEEIIGYETQLRRGA